jgi:hypothetical protein
MRTLDEPTWTFRSVHDCATDDDGGDNGRPQHQTPSRIRRDVDKDDGNNVTQRDAEPVVAGLSTHNGSGYI